MIAVSRTEWAKLKQYLQFLSERERDILVRVLEGQTEDEVGAAHGIKARAIGLSAKSSVERLRIRASLPSFDEAKFRADALLAGLDRRQTDFYIHYWREPNAILAGQKAGYENANAPRFVAALERSPILKPYFTAFDTLYRRYPQAKGRRPKVASKG